MHLAHQLPAALNLLDSRSLLASAGAIGVFLIIFAETGLLIGFFLPGDSLLFTAGLLAATGANTAGHLSLPAVLLGAAAGALAGAQVGYLIGRRAGAALLDRPGRPRLRRGITQAREFTERFGVRRAVILARFIPVVRTALNPIAGAIGIPLRIFTVWQVTGGLVWSLGIPVAGYALGSSVPSIDRYLLPVIGLIVVISFIPVAIELRRHRAAAPPGTPEKGTPDKGSATKDTLENRP